MKDDEDVPAAGEKVEPKTAAQPAVRPVVKAEPGACWMPLTGSPDRKLTLAAGRHERSQPL